MALSLDAQCLVKLQGAHKGTPLQALRAGHWVKLICGASFEDVAEVRNLSLVYALAGVDCIDCAADRAVVTAVTEGVHIAKDIARKSGCTLRKPWLMVSINDDEDPHFRKAEFNSMLCPPDCPRPCERVCPASAIYFNTLSSPVEGGVIPERCYGCGRCIPICPVHNIEARTFARSIDAVTDLLCSSEVDALEIHTGAGHLEAFQRLLQNISSSLHYLKLVAVSVPDLGETMHLAMNAMYESLQQHTVCPNLWQLDGRPMSGDIGRGATRACVKLGIRIASIANRPPGFLQLAGGTNSHTMEALRTAFAQDQDQHPPGSISRSSIAGIAYGGYARKVVNKLFTRMTTSSKIEDHPELLWEAVVEAGQLIWPVKLAAETI